MKLQHDPSIIERGEQTYVAAKRTVTMQTFPEVADRLPALMQHLASTGVTPSGPPFFRYDVIDMARALVVEAGVPIPADASPATSEEFFIGSLPAGRYVTTTHIGHPQELVEVTAEVLQWSAAKGL